MSDDDVARAGTTEASPPTRRRRARRLIRWLLMAGLVLVVALASIALSLLITPMQSVTAAGQTMKVGAAAPTWSLSGPGELELFGQQLPTVIEFQGPVRPKISLRRITLNEQLNQFAASGAETAGKQLENALVTGWTHFFVWQFVVTGIVALLLFGAVAGWARRGPGRTVALIVSGVLVTAAINAGAVMVTAYTAPGKLASVSSLQALVGSSPAPNPTGKTTAAHTEVRNVVVLGDSTAAGMGNALVLDPSDEDKACKRSRYSFGADLAVAKGWKVANLACAGATIRVGVLGDQQAGKVHVPPQLERPEVSQADLVIVNIGANDVNWLLMLQLCAISPDCSNNAEVAFFQQQLATFSSDLLQLVSQLQLLPNHPVVILNQYYDPFSDDLSCLAEHGLTEDKRDYLERNLAALNAVLADAAEAAGFKTAMPDFSEHGVCDPYPYVQGLDDKAPFHPTPSGQLAIAIADIQVLSEQDEQATAAPG